MTIVCGIDFSEPSRDAARIAARIARKRSEGLVLVHSAPFAALEHDQLRAALEAEAALLRDPELVITTRLCSGWPDEDLEQIALAMKASMIVVGAVGHRRGTHWIVGTIPERLAQRTASPLLVVRDASSLESWLDGTTDLTCVAGTDLTPSSHRVLDGIKSLGTLGRARVILTYVIYHPGQYARLDLSGPIYRRRPHPVVEEVVTRELDRQAVEISNAVSQDVAQALAAAGERLDAQLLCVGSSGAGGTAHPMFGSVARALLTRSRVPVLAVREM